MLIADSTNLLTYTSETALDALTLTVTDEAGDEVTVAAVPVSTDDLVWTVTLQSDEITDALLYQRLKLAWRLVAGDQVRTDVEYHEVTEDGIERRGSAVPVVQWPIYVASGWDIVREITFGRCDTDTDNQAAVRDAVRRAADALYAADTGVTSEKLGSYSYTLGRARTEGDAYGAAINALRGTGLTYRGI